MLPLEPLTSFGKLVLEGSENDAPLQGMDDLCIWHLERICLLKSRLVLLMFAFNNIMRLGLIPCPRAYYSVAFP